MSRIGPLSATCASRGRVAGGRRDLRGSRGSAFTAPSGSRNDRSESFRDVPHFSLTVELEIDALLELRKTVNGSLPPSSARISLNDFLVRACASALIKVPEANASFTPEGIFRHAQADISFAVAVEGGLFTPIVRGAEAKTLTEIAAETADLTRRARENKLEPSEFQGGTFSISNLGRFGIRQFTSIINEPQGCILSVGAGEKRPVVRGDQLAVATLMVATLTCDHRVVDGATGARWLQALKGMIEQPVTMLI